MQTNKLLFLASILAIGLAGSVQAAGHHGGNGSTAAAPAAAPGPAHSGGSAVHSGQGNFRYGGGPINSQRYSAYRSSTSAQRRFAPGTVRGTGAYNPARFSNARARNLATARGNHVSSARNGNRTTTNGANHVFARRSADWHRSWDRHHDHWWNGHRCRWVNNSWFIFDLGFYPWYGYPYNYYAYDYGYPYPYSYGYDYGYGYGQDGGVYDGGKVYDDNQGGDQPYNDSSNQNLDSTIAATQEALARQGYYRGQIDGVLGPATRTAILSYQRRNRLRVTGSLTGETLQSLSLRRVAGD